jgi:hypothetical protein
MKYVSALNAVSSQIWAAVLVVLGIAVFGVACMCHVAEVRSAMVSSGTGMIGGGIAMFQHQPKSGTETSIN